MLEITESFDEIKTMKNSKYEKMLRIQIQNTALEYLDRVLYKQDVGICVLGKCFTA